MDWDAQLKLQAFLDGELTDGEARQVEDWLARDPDAAALLRELRQTHALLAGFEEEIRLPESREFFWSKIKRGIERPEQPAPVPAALSWAGWLRRLLVPASAMALIGVAGFVASRQSSTPGLASGAEIETALADPGAFTYRDDNSGTTLVWLSYPAENDLADDDDASTVE
jgi:anti-sigma factor RsiW